MKNYSFKELAADVLGCIGGGALYSVAVNVFSVPNGIPQGGFTGIATMLNYLFPVLPVGTMILVLNVPLFIVAWIKLGKRFILKTVVFTSVFSVAIDVGAVWLPTYEGDKLLACVFCGVISGAGLALAFLRGATTGGTDIIAKLIYSKYPHIPIGRLVLLVDAAVVLTTGFVYKSAESAMYSAIVIYATSKLIDYILYGTGHCRLLMIVTEKAEKMSESIMDKLERGVTVLPVKGGYTGRDKSMLMCAVRASEANKLYKIVRQVDESAFTVVLDAGEILGEGFRRRPQ